MTAALTCSKLRERDVVANPMHLRSINHLLGLLQRPHHFPVLLCSSASVVSHRDISNDLENAHNPQVVLE